MIELECTAENEKIELQRIAREREVEHQTLLARISSDREVTKRDAFEHEAYVAQQQAAAKGEAIERNTEEGQVAHELEVRRRAELHEQALAQLAELLQQTAAAETQRQQRRLRFVVEHGDITGNHAPVFRVQQATK